MRFGEMLGLVWLNMLENKFRVLLTSLGIIVGAATIVLVIAIGQGGKQDVQDQFKNLSAGTIEVSYRPNFQGNMNNMESMRPNMPMGDRQEFSNRGNVRQGGNSGGNFKMPGIMSDVNLTKTDVEDIAYFVPDVSAVSIYAQTKCDITGGLIEDTQNTTVVGVMPEYEKISNLNVSLGSFIADTDNENTQKVCVLGRRFAEDTFGSAMQAYDNTIDINGRAFTVIGVLEEMGSVSSGISPDSAIFIPYDTGTKYVFGRNISSTLAAVANEVTNVSQVMEDITAVLDINHNGVTYSITDAGKGMEAALKSANILSILLISVASIVFIVGGIGIMNVLFVSVKERTKEIGILKALGCSNRDILTEFLFESGLISIFGGVVGVIVALAAMPLMKYTGMRVVPNATGCILALIFAVVTGTVFGFYPAVQAAALKPIDALNYE